MYILLYIILSLLQYRLIRNTTKNWFNINCPNLTWSRSSTNKMKPNVIFASILPLIGLIPLIVVCNFKYWTFKNIKMLNP